MANQSKKAPPPGHWLSEQEEAAWQDFWTGVDAIDALMKGERVQIADWIRCPHVMYRLWRIKVVIKRLNRAFGRA